MTQALGEDDRGRTNIRHPRIFGSVRTCRKAGRLFQCTCWKAAGSPVLSFSAAILGTGKGCCAERLLSSMKLLLPVCSWGQLLLSFCTPACMMSAVPCDVRPVCHLRATGWSELPVLGFLSRSREVSSSPSP